MQKNIAYGPLSKVWFTLKGHRFALIYPKNKPICFHILSQRYVVHPRTPIMNGQRPNWNIHNDTRNNKITETLVPLKISANQNI